MNNFIVYEIIKKFEESIFDIDVHLIANTNEKTFQYQFGKNIHAHKDEFFSRREFAEISSALFSTMGYVFVYYSEIEFIKALVKGEINLDKSIVYNLARDGIKEGKKSLVPSICDLYGVKYTGSNAFVISLLRNKYAFTSILKFNHIPVPKSWHFRYGIDNVLPKKNINVIIKNNCESASMGLTNSNIFNWDKKKFQRLLDDSNLSNDIIIQEFIDGIECEVFVIRYKNHYYAQEPIQILLKKGNVLTSELSNYYQYSFGLLRETISSTICEEIQHCAEKAAAILNVGSYARFDFRIKPNNKFYLFDIAGTPYTIKHSSINFLFSKVLQLNYDDIYKVIVYLTYTAD